MLGQLTLLGLTFLLSIPSLPHLAPVGVASWVALVAGFVAVAIAGAVILLALRELGASLTALPRPREGAVLVESGVYAHVRHPIYASLILGCLGWGAATRSLPSVVAALLLTLFLDAKARREERWLAERYPSFAAYRTRTRRFLPGIY